MITLIVYIVVLGLIAWMVNAYTPIPQTFKTLVTVVLVIIALLMVLNFFGVNLNGMPHR